MPIRIDATNKTLGRLASEIAKILQGKHRPDYDPRKTGDEVVEVYNVSKMKIDPKKLEKKFYIWHTGYPGGLRKKSLKELFEKKPEEVLKRAVWGMLPKNKLRKRRIKRLKIKK